MTLGSTPEVPPKYYVSAYLKVLVAVALLDREDKVQLLKLRCAMKCRRTTKVLQKQVITTLRSLMDKEEKVQLLKVRCIMKSRSTVKLLQCNFTTLDIPQVKFASSTAESTTKKLGQMQRHV